MFNLITTAYAMGGAPQANGAQPNWISSMLPLVIIFAIFYFLLIRPQQKQQKKIREMLSSVKRGDKIVTRGGIHGLVTGVTDKVLQVEIAENVKIKINREAVAFIDNETQETKPEETNK